MSISDVKQPSTSATSNPISDLMQPSTSAKLVKLTELYYTSWCLWQLHCLLILVHLFPDLRSSMPTPYKCKEKSCQNVRANAVWKLGLGIFALTLILHNTNINLIFSLRKGWMLLEFWNVPRTLLENFFQDSKSVLLSSASKSVLLSSASMEQQSPEHPFNSDCELVRSRFQQNFNATYVFGPFLATSFSSRSRGLSCLWVICAKRAPNSHENFVENFSSSLYIPSTSYHHSMRIRFYSQTQIKYLFKANVRLSRFTLVIKTLI